MAKTERPPLHALPERGAGWRRAGRVLGVSLAVVVASAVGVAGFLAWDLSRTFGGDETIALPSAEALPPAIGPYEGAFSVLLVGTDLCEPEYASLFGNRCEDDDGGERNDVTMLLHVSDEPRRATVVSFPRDMIVPIPSCPRADGSGSYSAMSAQPVNATMLYGGVPCTALTIEELTGIPTEFAAKITWGGVIRMSDAVGGVEVCVANGMDDPETGVILTPGTHELQGADALAFLRSRYSVGDGSDLGRISNQQQFMTSLVRKIRSGGVLSDPAALSRLAYATVDAVTPSEQLRNPIRLVQLAIALKDIPLEDIVFVQYPTFYDSQDANKVIPDRTSGDALMAAVLAGQPLTLTGDPSGGDGVVVVEPSTAPTPTPGATTEPDRVTLPDNVHGTNVGQVTCTQGNG